MSNTRTSRLLKLFDSFSLAYEEVSLAHIRQFIEPDASLKTIHRDVRFLVQAGLIRTRYSKEYKAYIRTDRLPSDEYFPGMYARTAESLVSSEGFYPPEWPDSQTERLYMEKIIRLCTLMIEVIRNEVEDPIACYRERYPELSNRTRQRDFKQLREVGYSFEYLPEDEDGPAGYYYDYPMVF